MKPGANSGEYQHRSACMHDLTPRLVANDGRGLGLREVDYRRIEAERSTQRHVTSARHDVSGLVRQQWDPRLFERQMSGENAAPSQSTRTSLSGRLLLSESADAGWQLILHGEAGQEVEHWDTRGTHWLSEHDELLRPTRTHEHASGQPPRVAECFTYSRVNGLNRRGRLVRQDDEAGSRLFDSYDLNGQVRGETRHFLATLDLPDWPDAVLEPGDGASTTYVHGPLQEVLAHTDTLGNQRYFSFNSSGELKSLALRLQDGSQYSLLTDTRYNACGQIESQTAGNGVVSRCEYEPATGRLSRLSASRPGRSLLQDLLYDYDPVGNVLKIEDRSQPLKHFANQRIEPVSTFIYDSLYQLIEATGREAAGSTVGPQLPELAPDPGDTGNLLNYRQHYDYDASGNLLELRHVGQQSYTRSLSVAGHSNHSVPAPGNPLAAFDPNGNLLALGAGQPLRWNARNQLHGTRQVGREDGADDEEHYRYGGDGLRVRKVGTRLVAGRMQSSETRYLPGLELHTRPGEHLSVITVQAGRGAIRCLHWSEGAPDGLTNPQLRYTLGDPFDCTALELDHQARIISHEGWYPFGGTAWWAARSALEASYKTHRYSGMERDSTGLYDYGLRYYAPWLMRWINPDPAGDVDGLNLYCMVSNNPLRFKDGDGLTRLDALDLDDKRASRAQMAQAYKQTNPALRQRLRLFSDMTQEMLTSAQEYSAKLNKMNEKNRQRYIRQHPGLLTVAAVKAASAHAGVMQGNDELYQDGFTNLAGSLSPRNLFPGVTLINRKSSLTFAPIPNEPSRHLGYYLVSNTNAMLKGIKEAYKAAGSELHGYLETLIRQHIEDSNFRIPIGAGIPGMHAEVRALNTLLQAADPQMLRSTLSQGFFFTERLVQAPGQPAGSDFPACYNCSGILPRIVQVVTGRVTPERRFVEKIRSTSPLKNRQI